jgi:transposase
MQDPLVSGELWQLVEPLLPVRPSRPKGGRPPVDDRMVLEGIVFVLRTGIGPLRPAGRTAAADRIDRLLTVDGATCPRRWAGHERCS